MFTPYGEAMLLSPRYGSGSLADVVPSLLARLGVDAETDRLGFDLDGVRRVCLLMVDGLGAEQLAAHPQEAPFLNLHRAAITAGFPTTTATSLSSVGTGLPPGQHGVVGYQVSIPGHPGLMNSLQWKLQSSANPHDLPEELVPERFQPIPTAFERARDAGVRMMHVGPAIQNGSGLTRACLRGAAFQQSWSAADLATETISGLAADGPTLIYSYYGDLDLIGHVRGPNSPAWRLELRNVDHIARTIASELPHDGALIVVSDHGMVEVERRFDYDMLPELREGVRVLGGEPRMRFLYTDDGAVHDVQSSWQRTLGSHFTIVTKDEAISRGWFGPTVSSAASGRIGDLLALANDGSAVVRSRAESIAATLIGHHGSLTSAELLVPACVIRPHQS